jgi:hypothetical protein
MDLLGLFFVACGVFSICGAVFDWDWFMNNRRAEFAVSIFGRRGARMFYAALGLAIIVLGALVASGAL